MIYFFYGKDTYRSKQKLNEVINEYKKEKTGINLRILNGKNLTLEELKNEVFGVSMFNEKKLIVIENIFKNEKFKEDFKAEKKDFINSENIILFYEETKVLKKDILYAAIRTKAEIHEFELLDDEKLKTWIILKINKLKGEISKEAIDLLVQYVGNDLWRMENELHKLFFYQKEINVETVELFINKKTETDIFKTIDAIGENDKGKAIKLLKDHLEKGENVFMLLAMIANQFRNMMIVKTKDYNETNLHPFVARKSYYQAKNFTLDELKEIYNKILEIDSGIKTGKVNEDLALEIFIAEI